MSIKLSIQNLEIKSFFFSIQLFDWSFALYPFAQFFPPLPTRFTASRERGCLLTQEVPNLENDGQCSERLVVESIRRQNGKTIVLSTHRTNLYGEVSRLEDNGTHFWEVPRRVFYNPLAVHNLVPKDNHQSNLYFIRMLWNKWSSVFNTPLSWW